VLSLLRSRYGPAGGTEPHESLRLATGQSGSHNGTRSRVEQIGGFTWQR